MQEMKKLGLVILMVIIGACTSTQQNPDDKTSQSRSNSGSLSFGRNANVNLNNIAVVHFAFDRSVIEDSEVRKLDAQANWLAANPKINVVIAGHTDDIGTSEYNLALVERRANATKAYLVKKGIRANRIETVSYGKDQPVAAGTSREARAANRRTVTTTK